MSQASAPSHNEADVAARAQLASAILKARRLMGLRGDDMIARHDAARGRANADLAKDGLAAQIAQAHGGDALAFCKRIRAAIPSAKPCRLTRPKPATFPEGMRDSHVRTQLRAGDIAGWGWDRLCGAAAAIDHEVVVTLRPRVRAEA